MMDCWLIEQKVDLSRDAPRMLLKEGTLMFAGNALAHIWRVTVRKDGQPVDLSAMTITGEFVRQDGATVHISGIATAEGIAEVRLAQACYTVPGKVRGMIKASANGQEVTLGALTFTVREGRTDLIVDPEETIPSLEELLALVERMETMLTEGGRILTDARTATTSATNAAQRATTAAVTAEGLIDDFTQNESIRSQNEQGRMDAETQRAESEQGRDASEAARVTGEQARRDAETQRADAEAGRALAEDARDQAETARQSAETDRETLYGQMKEDYESGAFDGEAATLSLLPAIHEPPLTDPYFEEAEGSTAQNRLYVPHLPAGAVQYATFSIDLDSGQLCMVTPPGLSGITFSLNDQTGNLEVWVNAE